MKGAKKSAGKYASFEFEQAVNLSNELTELSQLRLAL